MTKKSLFFGFFGTIELIPLIDFEDLKIRGKSNPMLSILSSKFDIFSPPRTTMVSNVCP